ncbi:MAG: hypothetical protein ACXWT0_03840 [Methylobacter sp.]
MKTLLIALMLLLSACEVERNVTNADVVVANKLCADNGGLGELFVTQKSAIFKSMISATCTNGVVIQKLGEKK